MDWEGKAVETASPMRLGECTKGLEMMEVRRLRGLERKLGANWRLYVYPEVLSK
jgi:hypothetical protein